LESLSTTPQNLLTMSDEIKKEENFDHFKKKIEEIGGKMGSCPNLTHLSDDKKKKIAKEAVQHCTELLMKTYMSLGISGSAGVELIEGLSGRRFRLSFVSIDPEEGGKNDNNNS